MFDMALPLTRLVLVTIAVQMALCEIFAATPEDKEKEIEQFFIDDIMRHPGGGRNNFMPLFTIAPFDEDRLGTGFVYTNDYAYSRDLGEWNNGQTPQDVEEQNVVDDVIRRAKEIIERFDPYVEKHDNSLS